MYVYQISGLPGAGKTTIQRELDKLGYDTIDSDEAWGYYGSLATEEPVERPADAPPVWFKDHGYIWNSARVRPFLSAPRTTPLFVCGGSRNENGFYDLFDKIFVLHVRDAVMRERLLARGDYSSTEPFIARVLEYNKRDVYEHAAQIDGIVIDTTEPLEDCMQLILGAIHATK